LKSYVPFLSLRYLWFHKVSSGLGILGVTLGVALVIVVVGVMDGFQTRIKRVLIGNTAAVVVKPYYDVDADALAEALKRTVPGVLEASPVVKQMTLIQPRDRAVQAPCLVVGIDAVREDRVSDLAKKLRRRDGSLSLLESASAEQPFREPEARAAMDRRIRPEKQGVLLSRRLLSELGVSVGREVHLFTARRKPGANGGQRIEGSAEIEVFLVTGSFESGDSEVDRQLVLMDRRDALSYFRELVPRDTDEVRLLLDDSDRCDEVRDLVLARKDRLMEASLKKGGRISAVPMDAMTWKDVNVDLVKAVENERGLLLVITSFSFIVVAFLIGSTQSMLVVEKTREIGVLRSLGASVAGTSSVFLANGFFIGTAGALAGWGTGVAITGHIQEIADFIRKTFNRNLFDENIYHFSSIPIDVKPGFVLSICIGAVCFALLGSILPAVRAALLDPVESLHHE
jgi:lipoprotein-releasing system permease protein